jgi:hypothetical protein
MNVTLFAALATAVMDPILIFGLHLGLPGAAISTVLSRCVLGVNDHRNGTSFARNRPPDLRPCCVEVLVTEV